MSNDRTRLIYLHAITPVHSGTGQSAAVVDLPVAREKGTGWPMIPASSLKGVVKDGLSGWDQCEAAFGNTDAAGAFCFTDQRILCMPIRSFYGTFAFVSSPMVLARFRRDAAALGAAEPFASQIPEVKKEEIALAEESILESKGRVYLEDLEMSARADMTANQIAESLASVLFSDDPGYFVSRFAVVADDVFAFLCETATEVTARVRLEETKKTVAAGGLWYEEAVPAEALFAGAVVLLASGNHRAAGVTLDDLKLSIVQIGGKSSVGRGLCRVVVAK